MTSYLQKMGWVSPSSDDDKPLVSENGHLLLDQDGVVRVNYDNEEMRRRLKRQLGYFSKIKVKEQEAS